MPVFPIGDTSKLEKAFDTDCTGADDHCEQIFTTRLIDEPFVPQFDSNFCQILFIILIIIVIIGNQLIRLKKYLNNNNICNNNISNNSNKRTDNNNKTVDKIRNNLNLNCFNNNNESLSDPMVEVDGRYNTVYNNMDNSEGYMEQEEEWEREGLLDPAWEKQQRKVTILLMQFI